MKHTALLTILIIILSLIMALPGAAQETDELAGTSWQLVSIDGEAVLEDSTVTLIFDEDNRAGGSAGCNSYGSAYTINGDRIAFEMPISTMMACEPEALMTQELAYLAALENVTGFELVDDQLILTDETGAQLVFEPLPSLEGSRWQVTTIGENEVSDELTLNFGTDNRATGTGGCNRFSTPYEVTDHTITFGPVISTRMACADEAASGQETSYFAALETATSFTLDGDQLTITFDDGQSLVLVRVNELVATQWLLQTIDGEAPVGDQPISLWFDEEGRVTGNGGCNGYSGGYSTDGESIRFTEIIRTEMACMQDGVMQQEAAYFDALNSATGYTLEDSQLTITYGDGQNLIFTPDTAQG